MTYGCARWASWSAPWNEVRGLWDEVWQNRKTLIPVRHAFSMGQEMHCLPVGETGIDEMQEKHERESKLMFMYVLSELSCGVILSMVALWQSPTKQEEVDSQIYSFQKTRKCVHLSKSTHFMHRTDEKELFKVNISNTAEEEALQKKKKKCDEDCLHNHTKEHKAHLMVKRVQPPPPPVHTPISPRHLSRTSLHSVRHVIITVRRLPWVAMFTADSVDRTLLKFSPVYKLSGSKA